MDGRGWGRAGARDESEARLRATRSRRTGRLPAPGWIVPPLGGAGRGSGHGAVRRGCCGGIAADGFAYDGEPLLCGCAGRIVFVSGSALPVLLDRCRCHAAETGRSKEEIE